MATVGANDNGLGLKAGGRHRHMAYMASPITAGLSEIGKRAKKFIGSKLSNNLHTDTKTTKSPPLFKSIYYSLCINRNNRSIPSVTCFCFILLGFLLVCQKFMFYVYTNSI